MKTSSHNVLFFTYVLLLYFYLCHNYHIEVSFCTLQYWVSPVLSHVYGRKTGYWKILSHPQIAHKGFASQSHDRTPHKIDSCLIYRMFPNQFILNMCPIIIWKMYCWKWECVCDSLAKSHPYSDMWQYIISCATHAYINSNWDWKKKHAVWLLRIISVTSINLEPPVFRL